MTHTSLLVVSSWAPPTLGGTPTVLRRLLYEIAHRTQVELTVLRQHVAPEEGSSDDFPWTTVTLKRPTFLAEIRGGHYSLVPAVFHRVLAHVRARSSCLTLITLPDESFAIAAAAACHLARRPYVLYVQNTFQEQAIHPAERLLARLVERRLFRGATSVLVISDALAELYKRKYDLDCVVIPHIVDPRELASIDERYVPEQLRGDRFAAFIGDIYAMNADSLARLSRAIGKNIPELRVVVVGRRRKYELEQMGIHADTVLTGAPTPVVHAILRHAAVLLAPLSFDAPFQQDVDAAIPTKVIEYLATGVPIIVHAPDSSALARSARHGQWAIVESRTDEDSLTASVRAALDDGVVRNRLRRQARAVCRSHRPDIVVSRFLECTGIARNGS